MKEDFAIINLVSLTHFSRVGITGIEESGIIGFPSNAGGARAPDSYWQQVTRCRLNQLQIADLRPVLGGTKADVLPVMAWVPPVKSHHALCVPHIYVDQRAIAAMQSLADVEHRLVLLSLALRVEVIVSSDLRRAHYTDTYQLFKPLTNPITPWHLIQQVARPGILLLDKTLRLGIACVLQIAKIIANHDAMQSLLDHFLLNKRGLHQCECGGHNFSLTRLSSTSCADTRKSLRLTHSRRRPSVRAFRVAARGNAML